MRHFARHLLTPLVAGIALTACGSSEAGTTDTTAASDSSTTTSVASSTTPPVGTTTPDSIGDTAASTTAAPATTAKPATTATTTTTTTTEPDDGVVRIAVTVAGGVVTVDDERVEIERGSTVELTVVADVADEVHVHGYDIYGDVTPADPAVITFVADIPGLFEVELEGARLPLVELQIG